MIRVSIIGSTGYFIKVDAKLRDADSAPSSPSGERHYCFDV